METHSSLNSSRRRGKKLCYLLGNLSAAEHMQLGHWVRSPLHGNSEQFVAMLDILLQHLKREDMPELNPEMFAHLLMPDRSLDAKKTQYIWVRLTQLYTEVLNYLAWARFNRNIPAQKTHLLEEVCNRGWEKLIPETFDAGIKSQPPVPNARRFRDELDLEIQYCHYLAGKGKQDKHLKALNTALDHHFLLQKLKYACAGIIEGESSADSTASPLLGLVLDYVALKIMEMPNVVQAYFFTYKMLLGIMNDDPSAEQHFEAFELLFVDPGAFAPSEAMDLFVHGQNFCTLQYARGKIKFVNQLVDLYERILNSKVAFESGLMPALFYKNTTELMCRLSRLEWASQFVESYGSHIAHDPKQLSYAYCKSVVLFYNAKFAEVFKLLYNKVGQLDALEMGTGARVYLCQTLWELGEWEWLSSSLTAFEQHLRRRVDLEPHLVKRYLKLVAYLKRACDAIAGRPDKRLPRIMQLRDQIEANEPANSFHWLRAKVAETIRAAEAGKLP